MILNAFIPQDGLKLTRILYYFEVVLLTKLNAVDDLVCGVLYPQHVSIHL